MYFLTHSVTQTVLLLKNLEIVFIATVQGACTTLNVSQLLDVYQHYQTN